VDLEDIIEVIYLDLIYNNNKIIEYKVYKAIYRPA